jgi:hypothetical protein
VRGVHRVVLDGVRGVHDAGVRPVHVVRAGVSAGRCAYPCVLAGVLGAGHHMHMLSYVLWVYAGVRGVLGGGAAGGLP